MLGRAIISPTLAVILIVLAIALALNSDARAAPLPLGNSTYQITPPLGAATANVPMIWNLPIRAPTDPSRTRIEPISVTDIEAFNPARETPAQASARKAGAIKTAIDAAVNAGTLPNTVVTEVKQAMVPGVVGVDRFGRPVLGQVPGMSWIQIAGVTRAVTVGTPAVPDPTREAGGGANWQQLPGGQPMPMRPSMGGSGSGTGLSTGLDPSGQQSVVGFGFWDPTEANSTLHIAALFPVAGETDREVLSDLATVFNTDFASAGFTASYNAATDTLSLDQTIPNTDLMWFANSDTGLNLIGDVSVVPEPASALLLMLGLATIGYMCQISKN